LLNDAEGCTSTYDKADDIGYEDFVHLIWFPFYGLNFVISLRDEDFGASITMTNSKLEFFSVKVKLGLL
jgi:hypothetical protein